MNVKKIFNIVFSDLPESKKIEMLENVFNFNLDEITDTIYDELRYEFQTYRSNRLKSSNVKFVNYDSDTQIMTITFNNNAVYEYYKVPMMLYLQVRNGLAAAKTTGKNRFGSWFKGKFPSNGAAVWKFLRRSNIKYKRVK
jgi:hypothetical protein